MPLTIFLYRIGRQRIVETRLNKVLVLGPEVECPPAWPACSSPGAIELGYAPNLLARACWMDALGRDSPTPVCSVCACVYGFMPFWLHLRVGICDFYLGLSNKARCGGAGGAGRRGSSRAGMSCMTPAASLVTIFMYTVSDQAVCRRAVLWWFGWAILLTFVYVDLCGWYIGLGVPSGPGGTLIIGRTRGYVVARSIL